MSHTYVKFGSRGCSHSHHGLLVLIFLHQAWAGICCEPRFIEALATVEEVAKQTRDDRCRSKSRQSTSPYVTITITISINTTITINNAYNHHHPDNHGRRHHHQSQIR